MNNSVENILEKQVRENKVSHAYLIEVNDYEKFNSSLNKMLQLLLCENNVGDDCQHCLLVNKKIHPNIKYIYPDGTYIRIDQIEELKKDFSTKPSFGRYNIYIIYDADKLNSSSANALLKFLEEPEENIIGILLTNKISSVLPTIYSRCQVYKNIYNEEQIDENVIEIANYIDKLVDEKLEIKSLKQYLDKIEDKNNIKYAFSYLLEEAIRMENISKSKILKEIVDKMRYNVNIELMIFDYYLRMCNNE